MPGPTWLPEAMDKYKRKLYHVKLRPQLAADLEGIHARAGIAQAQLTRIKDKVLTVLNAHGVLSDYHTEYYCYALALDKSQRTLAFMVDRIREHDILRTKWITRGLDPAILTELDDLLIFNKVSP
jgi:hypothetical protein